MAQGRSSLKWKIIAWLFVIVLFFVLGAGALAWFKVSNPELWGSVFTPTVINQTITQNVTEIHYEGKAPDNFWSTMKWVVAGIIVLGLAVIIFIWFWKHSSLRVKTREETRKEVEAIFKEPTMNVDLSHATYCEGFRYPDFEDANLKRDTHFWIKDFRSVGGSEQLLELNEGWDSVPSYLWIGMDLSVQDKNDRITVEGYGPKQYFEEVLNSVLFRRKGVRLSPGRQPEILTIMQMEEIMDKKKQIEEQKNQGAVQQ